MSATPALIAAAAGVAFGHAILPDHWLPLAVIGRTQRRPLRQLARLSGLAGVAHVLVSLLIGAVIVAVGLQFRGDIASAQNAIVGTILMATGAGFAIYALWERGHRHAHHHDHAHDGERRQGSVEHGGMRGLASIMVPFGAAASPDLTILPVFLAASAAGAFAAVGALVVFAAVTIATIVGLTLLASASGRQIEGRWLERWGNAVTAAVLLAIGVLVVSGAV